MVGTSDIVLSMAVSVFLCVIRTYAYTENVDARVYVRRVLPHPLHTVKGFNGGD